MESNTNIEKRKGEVYVLFEALLWSLFPIITVLSLKGLSSLIALAWTLLFSTIFFGIVILYNKKWQELKNFLLWKYVLVATLFIGIIYYGLYFIALTKTTPGNASIIGLMQVVTSFMFFNFLRKEKISGNYILGALLMVFGAVIVLFPKFSGIVIGDLLILLAICFAPLGNLFQQKAREIGSSESIMFMRSLISTPFIFLMAYFLGNNTNFSQIKSALPFLLINGFLILGLSKILWIEAIHRIPVTKAIALSSMSPFLVLFFSWLILHQNPNLWQLTALLPMTTGVLLLTDNLKFKKLAIQYYDKI